MQKSISIRIKAADAANEQSVKQAIAQACNTDQASITGYHILKRSIDARGRQTWINLQVHAYINEPTTPRETGSFHFTTTANTAKKVLIAGAGPAGLFAALKLLEAGIKPIIIERGKEVRARRRDLAMLNKTGEVNPESNYCFGEGGAGTYSDGKLYTRSSKRGDINRILQLFVKFGAENDILFDAHPHIGTNKLPQIITSMRQFIIDHGGEIHFEKKLVGLIIENDSLKGIQTSDGDTIPGDALILATGHSARDIFVMLHQQGILIDPKPFALGVRAEHPQSLIDKVQYHLPGDAATRPDYLPPASYSLVQQVDDKGVFSFCMCPGGIIAPAATSTGELVVNGWSPSKRNNPYANSGIVVTVNPEDAYQYLNSIPKNTLDFNPDLNDPLLLMRFQEQVEKNAFDAGGGKFVAPAQRLVDFCEGSLSSNLPDCSYLPGIRSVEMDTVLPSFIQQRLQKAFVEFGKKIRGYYSNEALVVATESRTSSPVRIPRDPESLQHPQIKGLFPCAEGAGYAGGIVSAAMDGERVADSIIQRVSI